MFVFAVEPFEVDENGAVVRASGVIQNPDDFKRFVQVFVARRVRMSETDFLPELQFVLLRDRVPDDGAFVVGIFKEFAFSKRVRFAVRLRNGGKVIRRRRDDRRALVTVAQSDRNRRFHFRRVARRTHQVVIFVRNQPDRVLVVKDRAENELQFASLGADD